MADNCISVYFDSTDSFWNYCWEDGSPDASWAPANVTTGLRKSQKLSTTITNNIKEGTAPRAWRTCQYYLRGMPAVCRWWKEGALSDDEDTTTSGQFFCSFVKDNTQENPQDPNNLIIPDDPSGYNFAQCDFLGRRKWCDDYEASVPDDLTEWICAAPNPYLTGLGDKSVGAEQAVFKPIPRDKIWGYNDKGDGTGTGLCDCHGFGRGAVGCALANLDDADSQTQSRLEADELSKLPIVCNFYRPYQMGFGIIEPMTKEADDIEPDGTITEKGWRRAQEWEENVEYRLPLNYEMYNKRSQFQKCQWWDEDTGRKYMQSGGFLYLDGAPDIFDSTGKVEFCTNPDDKTIPYNTRAFEDWDNEVEPYPFTSQMALEGVWAKGGGPVCNGCRPDCPGYSGKWNYIVNDKMLPGMPVTANQVLELRFWSADWDSQSQYDDFYDKKPNFDDTRSSHIYTFTKWKKIDPIDPDKSIMLGKDLSLCQPAPINNKEFTEDYVFSLDIEYANVETGTDAPGQRHFPSLIRNPDFIEINPLSVVYPYYNDYVFDAEPCLASGPAGHKKRHNTIYGDSIRAIGYTIRDKTVYVINGSVVPHSAKLRDHRGVYEVKPLLDKEALYRHAVDMITEAKENYPDYIVSAKSEATFGYFITESVRLKYNSANIIYIFVDYGDGTWEYRRRTVDSVWYGGVVKQNTYEHGYGDADSGYNNTQPDRITPGASVSMTVQPLGGSVSSSLLSSYSFENVATNRTTYGWSIRWITEFEQLQERWGPIGNTNIILAEINDLNINYIFDWEVEEAYLEAKTEEDENGIESKIGGEDIPDFVELEIVIQDDNSLPPNFCVLKPKDDIRYRFFNSIWELKISYKYKEFINEEPGEEDDVVEGAGKDAVSIWSSGPFSLQSFNESVQISNITTGPIQVLGYFYDENERLIATNATRALVYIVSERCRPVEIKYAYYAETMKMVLTPEGGFCIDISGVKPTGETVKIAETPNCGDHRYNIAKWEGPMWFPFNYCRGFDLYDEWTICNHCQAGYIGPINSGVARDEKGNLIFVGGTALKRNDFRYCGPYERQAYGIVRSAQPTPCNCGCVFYFADARDSSIIFSGYSNLMAAVDEREYKLENWLLPPFGNDGRDLVEKYLSHAYEMHAPLDSFLYPNTLSDWMPLVMDHSMFYFPDFNCFVSDNPEDVYYYISPSSSREPFAYTNQLNLFTSDSLSETITEDRFTWEDIFEVQHEGNCMYPPPAYPTGDVTKAVFYYFKDSSHAWAWQEYWKDIERGLTEEGESGGNKLKFLDLERPKYRWSAYKEEHQFICNEGLRQIIYYPPDFDDSGKLSLYPALSLDSGPKRPFKIIYNEDTYTSSNDIEWVDEGGDATVSGYADEDNIYEEANEDDWVHDYNTLFDSDASADKEVAHQIVTSIDFFTGDEEYGYYNRGLIVNITRDRLDYLPRWNYEFSYVKEGSTNGRFGNIETEHTEIYSGIQPIGGDLVWNEENVTISGGVHTNFGISIARLYLKGNLGYMDALKGNLGYMDALEVNQYNELIKPIVSLSVNFLDGSSGTPRGYNSSIMELITPVDVFGPPTPGLKLLEYTIDLKFDLGPLELAAGKRIKDFFINITGQFGSFISISELTLTTAKLKTASNSSGELENIRPWERKYRVSEMSGITDNLDGPEDYLQYDLKLRNAGQYFPFTGSKFNDQEFFSATAQSKMRSVTCGVRYIDNIPVEITYGTLHDVELGEQKFWYEWAPGRDAVGDSLNFSAFAPIKIEEALLANGVQYTNPGGMFLYSEKLPWEKTDKFKQFKQYDYWRPGGHSYEWSQEWTKAKCYIFDSPHTIFSGDYRHHSHPYPKGLVDEAETILNSYYNLRFETVKAKMRRAEILGGSVSATDLLTTANPYNVVR